MAQLSCQRTGAAYTLPGWWASDAFGLRGAAR
jgi:hypothetical protein